MRWNRIPNIWARVIEPDRKVSHRVKRFRPVKFDFQRAAQRCHIKLHYQDLSGTQRVLTCTVAEAVQRYLRPGRWLVPRDMSSTVFDELRRSAEWPVDYRNNEPYSAVLEYALIDLEARMHPNSEMVRARGPQLFALDCLPDYPQRDRSVVRKAFQSLSSGKFSTFAITTRFELRRAQPENNLREEHALLAENDSPMSTQRGQDVQDGIVQGHSDGAKTLVESSTTSSQMFGELQLSSDQNLEHNVRDLGTLLLGSERRTHDGSTETMIAETKDGFIQSVMPLDEQKLDQLLLREQRVEENRVSRSRPGSSSNISQLASDEEADLDSIPVDQNLSGSFPDTHHSGNTLYPSRRSEPDMVQNKAIEDQASQDSSSTDDKVAAVERSEQRNTIHVAEPFGKQVYDPSLILCRRQRRWQHQPSGGTYRILAWACKYMPHLWPEVIAACMPRGCKIDIHPRTDRGSIQYVIQPPVEKAVRAVFHELETRESETWL